MTENDKAPEDERTREAEAMILEAIGRQELRMTILENLRIRGFSYDEAKELIYKARVTLAGGEPAWYGFAATLAGIGDFAVPWGRHHYYSYHESEV